MSRGKAKGIPTWRMGPMGPHFYSKWLVLSGETKPVRTNPILKGDENDHHGSGQIPQKGSCLEGKWDPGYFREI